MSLGFKRLTYYSPICDHEVTIEANTLRDATPHLLQNLLLQHSEYPSRWSMPQVPPKRWQTSATRRNTSEVSIFGGGWQPPVGQGLLTHDVSISHTKTQHSLWDCSGRVISSSQSPLPGNTQQSQQTNIHAPGGIRNHNFSRRATADLRLRSRGRWDRLGRMYSSF